jgi:hypothetical protein
MLTAEGAEILRSLDRRIGEGWCDQQRIANSCDELLHCLIGNGIFSAKIDGFIHAVTMTTPFILRHMEELASSQRSALSLRELTSWRPLDSAMRYAHWQVDFHWKIDTRLWQYLLLVKFMRMSYESAIKDADGLSDPDRSLLLRGNIAFWDAVEIAYSYKSEIIERSRSFAPHPDKSAGSSNHGYTYRPMTPEPYYNFDELGFDLIGTASDTVTEPTGYPDLQSVKFGTLTEAARRWIRDAQSVGLCDQYLRLRLGERFVPTRLDGWEAALTDLARYVRPDCEDPLVRALGELGTEGSADLLPRFFAKTQLEFGRRLSGLALPELVQLLRTIGPALQQLLGDQHAEEDIDTFCEKVISSASDEDSNADVSFSDLIELVRPIHPRYAAYDPLEPLPWQARNQERYVARMRRLGYEL